MQAELQEKRAEEIHLAELTATAKNDEEVIAKLHKVSSALSCHLSAISLTLQCTSCTQVSGLHQTCMGVLMHTLRGICERAFYSILVLRTLHAG